MTLIAAVHETLCCCSLIPFSQVEPQGSSEQVVPVPMQALLPAQAAGDGCSQGNSTAAALLGAELHSHHLCHPNNQNLAPELDLFVRL